MSQPKNKLTGLFINELYKLALHKQSFFDAVIHNLSYTFIPVELISHKKILKSMLNIAKVTGKMPTYGTISQQHNIDTEVQLTLEDIKDSKLIEEEHALTELEAYIKSMRFQLLNDKIVALYKDEKKDEAIELSAKESLEIVNYSIRNNSGKFLKVYEDFEEQMKIRGETKDEISHEKVPFGIDILDDITGGGIDVSDIVLYIARSGVGKSTWLKWTAWYASRLGFAVLHIQLEGSKEEAYSKYTQVWTAQSYSSVAKGNIPNDVMEKLLQTAKVQENKDKDISIYAFEQFDEASMKDIRDIVIEYQKINNKVPDLIVIDSLDLVMPGDGMKYGVDTQSIKMKLQNSAKKMKNLAVEMNTRIVTATQTGDVPPTIWNDIDKTITRNHTEGDRTLVKPFSAVITLNQTDDEKRAKEARLYIDKFRNYSVGKAVYKICTHYENGRFYDRKRSLKKFYSDDKG